MDTAHCILITDYVQGTEGADRADHGVGPKDSVHALLCGQEVV